MVVKGDRILLSHAYSRTRSLTRQLPISGDHLSIQRMLRILLAAVFSLCFSIQTFGLTMSINLPLSSDVYVDIRAGSLDEMQHSKPALSSGHHECVDKLPICEMEGECSFQHCSAGGGLTMDSAEIGIYRHSSAKFRYAHHVPNAPRSSLYKPPIA